jgi:primosomal protein N' (replication factor Y)
MSSAARSRSTLAGPVAVCVDRPVLSLDRPFTYDLPAELGAGVGSCVQVPFHGRLVRGWVLGPTDDVPERMLPVRRLVSPVRFFDERMLSMFRWMRERYVASLAAVIGRAVPPRVASEEQALARAAPEPVRIDIAADQRALAAYREGSALLAALGGSRAGTFVLRPAPGDEAAVAVACVGTALAAGRTAIVVVPEAEPLPATATAIVEAFGKTVGLFLGGDRRARYRLWLRIADGRFRVVVGTRPAVFAPLRDLGLVYVHRESHALHREERAPYYHVRDVARARAEAEAAVCVLASLCPSIETTAFAHTLVEPARRTWPPVEVVRPGPEGRSPRLLRALAEARRAFLFEPIRGYGVARVCKACGEPAACAVCLGTMRLSAGTVTCTVCQAPGRCASCGAARFGVVRGGIERVEEWARGVARVKVSALGPGDRARPPADAEVLVGGIDAVKDLGPVGLDLVAILSADESLRRPGLSARERALVAWFEAAAWAGTGGHVIVQTSHPNDPAVQALVAGDPARFQRTEARRLAEAGFPVGSCVFRVTGTAGLAEALEQVPHRALLVSAAGEATVCLAALDPGALGTFGETVRRLAERGVVTRVEAEPHL